MGKVICKHCGASINSYARECEYCGMAVQSQGSGSTQDFVNDVLGQVNSATKKFDEAMANDVSQDKVFGVLAYLGFLWLIPFFMRRDKQFVRFHLNQALILLICQAIIYVLTFVSKAISFNIGGYISILNFALGILSIVGIVHAIKGEEKELPLIGQFRIIS